MLQYDLTASERTTFGKGANRALRRQGQTPAILYGPKAEPVALQLETRELTRILVKWQKRNAVFNIDINGNVRHVMVKEVQARPVDNALLHVDFHEISLDEPMVISVPVVFTGKAKGVDLGGDMHVSRTTVEVKAKPLDVPDTIDIDVTPLGMGDSLKCGDLEIPEKVELLNGADEPLVSIVSGAAKAAAAAAAEAEEEAAEEAAA